MDFSRSKRILQGILVSCLWLGAGAGCAPADPDSVSDQGYQDWEDAIAGRLAYLSVVSRNTFGRSESPLMVSAQFVDFRGVELAAVRQSLGLWAPPEDQIPEECILSPQAPEIGLEDWSPSRVLLMHAGTIQVEGVGAPVDLVPRRMPDLFPFFRGYTYGTADEERPCYPPGSYVELQSAGGQDVDAFWVVLQVPQPLMLTHINGLAVGSVDELDVPELDAGLGLTWTPSLNQDVVTITLEGDGHNAGATLVCTAIDDGEVFLSPQALQSFLSASNQSSFRLTLRRANLQQFQLPGFDLAQAAALTEHSLLLY